VQTQGSLQESDLATLLQTMQSERATGTLTLENGTDSCALYFLFGHLFHAAGPGGDGEDVVVRALGWRSGTFHFDPRAKLPAEETIKSSPAELIAAAEAGAEPAAAAASSGSSAWEAPSLRALDGQGDSPGTTPSRQESQAPAPSVWSPAATVPAAAAAESPWTPSASADEPSGLESWTATQQAPTETAPAYAPAEYTPSYVPAQPAPLAAVAEPPRAAASGEPTPAAAGAASQAAVGSLPIPSGHAQYEGLKSAFVDFPRLLRTLRSDRHTGYIRLLSGGSTGVLLFRDGELVEAEAGDDGFAHGEDAFLIFRRQMDTGEGVIDVIDLDSDTVTSVARLLTGPPVFTGLLARFVNFEALLEYLSEERLNGSIIIVGGSETGVILLKDGGVLAAYTSGSRTPQSGTEAVAALAGERPARIEVRGDDSARGGIDAEAVLSRPY
jgi:hypothetical protein